MPRVPHASEAAPAPGGWYSQSVRAHEIVWASGQGGVNPATGELAGEDVGSQTRQAVRNLQAVLEASGATLDDVVRVGVYLTDPEDRTSMNEVYKAFFGEAPPARTTVSVRLPGAMKVEIDAMAVVDT